MMVGVADALAAEDIPGAQLQLYAECGHWPPERAALHNPLSLEFLAKASAKAGPCVPQVGHARSA